MNLEFDIENPPDLHIVQSPALTKEYKLVQWDYEL